MLVLLTIFVACSGYNVPNPPAGNGNGKVNVDFSYSIEHPFYVHFENKSDNAPKYHWDFGDGQSSTEKSPTHKYNSKGVYKVVLTIGDTKKSYTCTKTVTISEPTKCYITGVVYENIPQNNEYYSIRFTDDYLIFETCYWYTEWTLLSSANLPFKHVFNSKRQIDFGESKYIMRLYQNSSKSGSGSQIEKFSIYTNDIKTKYLESITGTTKNAKIKLLLNWED